MPVYTLACRQTIKAPKSQNIADAITRVHCEVTGAPPEFVNVIFMFGQSLATDVQIAVGGNVRSGGNRNKELTDSLRDAIHEAVAEAAGLSSSQVSAALIGFPASWAMEGGEILPEPGEEDAWLERAEQRQA